MTVDIGLGWAETVTLHPRTGVTLDDAGSSIPAYGTAVAIGSTIVAPIVASETEIGGDVVTTGWSLQWIGQPSPMPKATDEVTLRGVRYRCDADPQVYHNPFEGSETTVLKLLARV